MPRAETQAAQVRPGDRFGTLLLDSVSGEQVPIPDRSRLVHLQFRRFAGCPVCSLHLREFVRRHDELTGQGIREVAVFHSTREVLQEHHRDIPFALVPDPQHRLYREYGVAASLRSLIHPASWVPALRGMLARGVHLPENATGAFGLPADLLISPDGLVLAAHYGRHADDQWSVAEVLALAPGAVR
jgi:peroxiredoxin